MTDTQALLSLDGAFLFRYTRDADPLEHLESTGGLIAITSPDSLIV